MRSTIKDRLFKWSIPEPNSGCWLWFGTTSHTGYGRLTIRGEGKLRIVGAHRLSFEEFKGPIPEGHFVCHRCDNRACINPDHLYAGTALTNNQDMVRKQRQRFCPGEKNGQARLTAEEILAIRSDNRPLADIAADYGLVFQHVSDIKNGNRWKHVGGPIGHVDHRAGGLSRRTEQKL